MSKPKKVLVVIGGSRGIGAAVAWRGISDGYTVVIGFHDSADAAFALCEKAKECGGIMSAFQIEASDPSSVEKFFYASEVSFGPPAAMVYASGVSERPLRLINIPAESVARVINTTLLGAFYAVQSASRRMVFSRNGTGGCIVLITSEAGKFGGNLISPYAASKAGLNAMIIGAARELAIEGVRLNGVSPGVIDTDQHAGISNERRQSLLSSIPMGRMGSAEEVANAVSWLLSDEASYVAGSILSISGGR